MGSSSPGMGPAEGSGSPSHLREHSDTDSNEEDNPINLSFAHSVLADDPLGDEPHPQYVPRNT